MHNQNRKEKKRKMGRTEWGNGARECHKLKSQIWLLEVVLLLKNRKENRVGERNFFSITFSYYRYTKWDSATPVFLQKIFATVQARKHSQI